MIRLLPRGDAPRRGAPPTAATLRKREQLLLFVEREMAPHAAVQGVVAIGSVAAGVAHAGSDIDVIVFLEPLDLFVAPAEFIYRPSDRSFHSIFSDAEGIQLDLARLSMAEWADEAFVWPEPRRQELQAGWLAYDRDGQVARLIAERTAYDDATRIAALDEALTWLDQHLGEDGPERRWERLGPLVAHDRLSAAYHYLVQGLFAYNRQWRPWRNREMTALLGLPWLPEHFEDRAMLALSAPAPERAGYMARVETLLSLFEDLVEQLVADGVYGDDPIGEAFIRSNEEPGRSWNMDAWNTEHQRRYG